MSSLEEYGAVSFRGFKSTRTPQGFRRFLEALPLRPCADPLSSVNVRRILSPADGVYEAVNAPELASTFIGLHNDATFRLTAPYAAFVCFEPAER